MEIKKPEKLPQPKMGYFQHTCWLDDAGELVLSAQKVKTDVDLVDEDKDLVSLANEVLQSNLKSKLLKKRELKPGETDTIILKYLI